MAKLIRRRKGFTLVELLVVITIIGMLIALLVPAIGAVREAARRAQCINNLSQWATAVKTYDSQKGQYPGLAMNFQAKVNGVSPSPRTFQVSWQTALLPFIQRNDIYADLSNPIQANNFFYKKFNQIPYLDVAVCPSTPALDKSNPYTNYVANAGHYDANIDPLAGWQGNSTYPQGIPKTVGPDTRFTAVFHDQSLIRVFNPTTTPTQTNPAVPTNSARSDVPVVMTSSIIITGDGEANTLMLGENVDAQFWVTYPDLTNSGNNPGSNPNSPTIPIPSCFPCHEEFLGFLYYNSADGSTYSVNDVNQGKLPLGLKPGAKNAEHARPSSSHPGGVVFAFCDGRIKFCKDEISTLSTTITVNPVPPSPYQKNITYSLMQIMMSPNSHTNMYLQEPSPTGVTTFTD